ncbi:hypothetical protein ACP4OV_013164 [Aristida adscensionis]
MASPAKRRRAEDDAAPSALESLPSHVFATILQRAGARGAAALASASATLRAAASAEAHWRRFCAEDIGIDAPVDPDGRLLPFFKEAYKSWSQSFRMYPLPLVKRVKSFWNSLKSWLSEYYPDALETLAEGLPDFDIRSAELKLGCLLPLPTKLLYRFCNGQIWNEHLASCGIMGGYEFNFGMVNVHLLSLNDAVKTAKMLSREHHGVLNIYRYIVVAKSSSQEKMFVLDCLSGQLYVGTENLKSLGETMPCVPYSLISLHMDAQNHMPQDGLLLWLEEHLRRLQGGLINLRCYNHLNLSNSRHISLFPEMPPSCSSVLRMVCASAVFVMEKSTTGEDPCKYVYNYCIHLSIPEACIVEGVHYSSCQISSYDLMITSGDDVVHDGQEYQGRFVNLEKGGHMVKYGRYKLPSMEPASVEGTITLVSIAKN